MMPGERTVAWSVIGGSAVFFFLLALLLGSTSLAMSPPPVAEDHPGEKAAPPPAPAPRPKGLDGLPCFECHNRRRYENGESFSHSIHKEEVGHCHACHVIDGHFHIGVRKSTCEECH